MARTSSNSKKASFSNLKIIWTKILVVTIRDCLQCAFSLKIRLVLISTSAIATRRYVTIID